MSTFTLTRHLFSTDKMQDILSDAACVQRMLDVEAALALAQAETGVIPDSAARTIAAICQLGSVDLDLLARDAAAAGNLAIPLVRQLTARVQAIDPVAARYVHWGATSQDIIDTALVLQLQQAIATLSAQLQHCGDGLAALAVRYRDTPQIGRTWMQHALPITFGLKVAGWLDGLQRHRQRLRDIGPRLEVLQFGGAAGTLASLGDKGLMVSDALAARLALYVPTMPWHSQRDRIVEVGLACGALVGSLGKMARDISLMTQTETAEVAEPDAPGRGGSSAMPHKRNPLSCAITLAAATRTPGLVATLLSGMVQENERALGGWQAEWDTLPDILSLTAAALEQMDLLAYQMTVDTERMRANIDMTQGLIMAEAISLALAPTMGKQAAHSLLEQASRRAIDQKRSLLQVLQDDPQLAGGLSASAIAQLMEPSGYVGEAGAFVDRVLSSWHGQ